MDATTKPTVNWGVILKDAVIAAIIAFGLFSLMLGFKADQTLNNEMILVPRPFLLWSVIGLVFLSRIAIGYWQFSKTARMEADLPPIRVSEIIGRYGVMIAAGLFLLFALAIIVSLGMNGVVDWLRRAWFGIALYFALAGLIQKLAARRAAAPVNQPSSVWMLKAEKFGLPLMVGFLTAYPIFVLATVGPQGAIKWIDNFGIQILIYIMLGWGLNIVVGLAGLLDLGYVAFYAVGAYSYALLATSEPLKDFLAQVIGEGFWPAWAFWICLPLAGILAAFWGVLLGFPVLRLRGDYLAIVTLAFGEIIRLVLINWVAFSNGYAGISSIPRPSFFGVPFNATDQGFAATFGLEFSPIYRTIFLFYVILALALLTAAVSMRLRRLPVGRAWEALREDEIACRSLGINTVNTKLTAFSIGAMFGGFAGAFFAARQGFISPESFVFLESAQILAIVVLGGMGSLLGVVIASILLVGGVEILRELDFLKLYFGDGFDPAQYRMLIFGICMVLMMLWKPRGLISAREPTVFLKEKKIVSGNFVKEGHG